MIAMAMAAVAAANSFVILYAMGLAFSTSTAIVVLVAFILGNRVRLAGLHFGYGSWLRFLAYGLLILFVTGGVLSFWIAMRWEQGFDDPTWPQPPPYPDVWLESYAKWVIQSRHPPGTFGSGTTDFRIVQVSLYAVFWMFTALVAFQIGLMFKACGLWRIFRNLRDQIVALFSPAPTS